VAEGRKKKVEECQEIRPNRLEDRGGAGEKGGHRLNRVMENPDCTCLPKIPIEVSGGKSYGTFEETPTNKGKLSRGWGGWYDHD